MAVHRLLAVLGVVVIAGAMAAGGDGDYVEGASPESLPTAASDAAIIGSARSRSSRQPQLDMGASDAAIVGVGVGESHHDLGDAESAGPPAPLPSKKGDDVAMPIDFDSHEVDDAVIDESIKWPVFFKECDFAGTKVDLETSVPDVADVGINHNDISSMKVPQGFVVTIYSDRGFMGFSKTFTGSSVHCLANYEMGDGKNWDNEVESIKVVSSKPAKVGDDGKEAKDKEKQQKKQEEINTEKEAKAKIKIREDLMVADQKKAQMKEKSTKDEASSEAKSKAADSSHGSAKEDEESAKAKQENAKKNEELNNKQDEKNAKSQTEKETKHDTETKREGHVKMTAKEKRQKLDTAKTNEVDIAEKHQKAQDETRQKSTKKEEESAKKLYKEKKTEEASAKVSLNDVDEAAESAEKAERFAKEMKTKSSEKGSKLVAVEKEAKGVAHAKGQTADKLGVAEREAKKHEQDAKSHERDSKNKEEKAKAGAEMREKSDEQARKITAEREKTSKLIRTRVEFATKKAKGQAESANKKEKDAKFERAKKEETVKEGDTKEGKHKETIQKAAVEERVQKLASLRKSIAGAEADVATAKKKHEVAEKSVDMMRIHRAENDDEASKKLIKRRQEQQKMAAQSEQVVKARLAEAARTLEEAEEQKREFTDKAERVEKAKAKAQEEREKRSSALEGKNKREAEDAQVSQEKSQKAEAEAASIEEKRARDEETKKRQDERHKKTVKRDVENEDNLRKDNEAAAKKQRVTRIKFEQMTEKEEKLVYTAEIKEKESEKKEKSSTEATEKEEVHSKDLKKAQQRKDKEAEVMEKKAETLDKQKELSDKAAIKAKEKGQKMKMAESGIKSAVDQSDDSTRENMSKLNDAHTANSESQEKEEKGKANGSAELMEDLKAAESAAKKKIEVVEKSETDAKNLLKERTGKKVRHKAEQKKMDDDTEKAEKSTEKRSKKEKVLKDDSEAFKERGQKDQTSEQQLKSKAQEKVSKSQLFLKSEKKVKEEEKSVKTKKELDEKARDKAIELKKEVNGKHEQAAKDLAAAELKSQESEKKVARAKEDREAQRSKLAEKDGKAAKVLKLNLHTKVTSLKAVTEKHTKEALTKMERKAEAKGKALKSAEENESNALKTKNSKAVLVTDALKKAAEQTQIISDSKEELQAARDQLMEATSDEKRKMARMKVHELENKMVDKKSAQQAVTDENVEVNLMFEHSVKHEQKQKDDVKELRMKHASYEEAEKGIQRTNDEKVRKRKESDEKEVISKSDLKEKKHKEAIAAHQEKFEKFASKEAVTKINKARKLEKDAIAEKEKAKHAAYVSQNAVDEKKRKQASKTVAEAVDRKHEAAKALREAFVKKAETQANVLLMHQEKARKIARRLDEANELLSKKSTEAVAAKTTLGVAEKHLVDATQALQSKESPEAKKIAKTKYTKARGEKEAALQANNIAQEKKRKAQGTVDADKVKQDSIAKDTKALNEQKSKTDERVEKATEECAAAQHAQENMKEKYDQMKAKFNDWKIRTKSHNEQASKKKKAMNIWADLEKETQKMQEDDKDASLAPRVAPGHGHQTPEQAKENLSKGITAHQHNSATALAMQILGKKSPEDEKKEKEQKEAEKMKQKAKVISFQHRNHPLLIFAKERKQKCMESDLPDSFSKERCGKADSAVLHFGKLKKAAMNDDNLAPDTFHKWNERVGGDLDNLERKVELLPLPTGEDPEPKIKETEPSNEDDDRGPTDRPEAEQDVRPDDEPVDIPDDVLLQESSSGCAGLAGCQKKARVLRKETASVTSSSENCDKNDIKLNAQLAEHSKQQSVVEAKLAKTRATLKALSADVPTLKEAANAAADAAIASSRLMRAAHKAATSGKDVQHAVEQAAKAKSDQVLAELRVSQALVSEEA